MTYTSACARNNFMKSVAKFLKQVSAASLFVGWNYSHLQTGILYQNTQQQRRRRQEQQQRVVVVHVPQQSGV